MARSVRRTSIVARYARVQQPGNFLNRQLPYPPLGCLYKEHKTTTKEQKYNFRADSCRQHASMRFRLNETERVNHKYRNYPFTTQTDRLSVPSWSTFTFVQVLCTVFHVLLQRREISVSFKVIHFQELVCVWVCKADWHCKDVTLHVHYVIYNDYLKMKTNTGAHFYLCNWTVDSLLTSATLWWRLTPPCTHICRL